ncbi:uncharacterized protein [Phaseolus vulgaris]|uniref:uncharacterized protein n=1 Tax=Phaseolus vulgaris TaxID=3885 RepID=UPI0035C9740A
MRLPFKYLGIEVEGNPRKKELWEFVVNKIKARLNSWKRRILSMTGKICLLKLVFTAIPLLYLSFFKALASVCNSIISIQRKFLLAWSRDNKAIPWLISDEKGKWKDILISKYGLERGISLVRLKYQSWWWMDLDQVCGEGEEEGWFKMAVAWKVGIGELLGGFWVAMAVKLEEGKV